MSRGLRVAAWRRARRSLRPAGVGLVLSLAAACGGFTPAKFKTSESLFAASVDQYKRGKHENAAKGFERLTLDLPARDPLLPVAFWYLALTYEKRTEHLFAAQNFQRLSETFPDDSLADDALFQAGKAYAAMWRVPQLDPQYALLAQGTWRALLTNYPETSLRDSVNRALNDLDDKLASKDFDAAMYYLRRNAFDSAIIYLKDVMKTYPATAHARLAGLRLLFAYRQIKYGEEAKELCDSMAKAYPQDAEVKTACASQAVKR